MTKTFSWICNSQDLAVQFITLLLHVFSPKPSQFWHLHFCTFDISKNHPKVCNVCEIFKKNHYDFAFLSWSWTVHWTSLHFMYKDVRADWKIFIYFSGSSILLLIQWNTGQAGLSNKSKAKSQKSTSVKVSSSSRGWKCGNGGSCWALFRVPSLGGWLWGWWGVQWGLEEGHFLNINCNCSVIIDQLSLICGGCKLW